MKVVITQPNYLPWLGYFAQLQASDVWVVLDDVQYSRREWQNRNRIVGPYINPSYLSLPIKKAPRCSLINEIHISSDFKPSDHLSLISTFYSKCPYYSEFFLYYLLC